jgi:hypothetical protein
MTPAKDLIDKLKVRYGMALEAVGESFAEDIFEAITALREKDARIAELERDAARYRHLRSKDVLTIQKGGVFAGMTPQNTILTEEHLDRVVDIEMNAHKTLKE